MRRGKSFLHHMTSESSYWLKYNTFGHRVVQLTTKEFVVRGLICLFVCLFEVELSKELESSSSASRRSFWKALKKMSKELQSSDLKVEPSNGK